MTVQVKLLWSVGKALFMINMVATHATSKHLLNNMQHHICNKHGRKLMLKTEKTYKEKSPTTKRKKYPKCKTGRSHHWILETPSGTYSKGTCKICRKVVKGLFRNSLDYSIWFQKTNKGNSLGKYALGNNRETGK